MKLLFLDIDGVLNDHSRLPSGYSRIFPEKVEILNTILEADPTIRIVLSSAWRTTFDTPGSINVLLMIHGLAHDKRVLGRTRKDPELWYPGHPRAYDRAYWSEKGLKWRVAQIKSYLSVYAHSSFVVLDDLPLDIPNLVQTDPHVGLTEEHVPQILALLGVGVY